LPDSVNVALMLAGLQELLVVHPDLLPWAAGATGLPIDRRQLQLQRQLAVLLFAPVMVSACWCPNRRWS
jgi:hypothetical protein